MRSGRLIALITALVLLAAPPAQAYIGPGAGAGTIAAVLGILASIVMAFFAILWYPIKRMRKKRKLARESASRETKEDAPDDAEGAKDS